MNTRRRILRTALFVAAALIFLLSAGMLLRYFLQAQASQAVTHHAIEAAVTDVQPPSLPTASTEPEAELPETSAPEAAITPDICPISVDFDTLLQQNSQIIGWIYCPDTPIHYPVVQAADNSYYLRRLLDGQWNPSGTLFLDYRNDAALSDSLSVIYGHNMKNNSMFGTLPSYRQQSYYEAHPVMFFLTPTKTYRLELLAGFAASDNDALYDLPDSAEAVAELVASAMAQSDFTAPYTPAADDRFLALSTCLYDSQQSRYLLLGVLRPMDTQSETAK